MITVFATETARRFHQSPHCKLFQSAQDLNDWDCGCDMYCTHRSPRLRRLQGVPRDAAIAAGQLPCWACYRGTLALPPSREDFGHRPFVYDGVPVCERCYYQHRSFRETVAWPCTSAVVLGLDR